VKHAKLLRADNVRLTYPPRFRQHKEIAAPDADPEDLTAPEDDDVETDLRPEPGSPRTLVNEPVKALRGVTFSVNAGDGLGILGRVGSGRSTLLAVLSGVLRPTSGKVRIRGWATGLMGASVGFLADLPVRENIVRNAVIMGMSNNRAEDLAPEIAEFAGLAGYLDSPLRDITRLHARRIGYTVALFAEPTIFLGDEELVMGSPQFREASLKRLAEFPDESRALIVVSNRAEHLKQLCNRAIVLDRGTVTFDGSVEDALRRYRRGSRSGRTGATEPPEPTSGRESEPDPD
jgi:ABC-type polysaccharide/polyol phosphate transport system ATPase subunit